MRINYESYPMLHGKKNINYLTFEFAKFLDGINIDENVLMKNFSGKKEISFLLNGMCYCFIVLNDEIFGEVFVNNILMLSQTFKCDKVRKSINHDLEAGLLFYNIPETIKEELCSKGETFDDYLEGVGISSFMLLLRFFYYIENEGCFDKKIISSDKKMGYKNSIELNGEKIESEFKFPIKIYGKNKHTVLHRTGTFDVKKFFRFQRVGKGRQVIKKVEVKPHVRHKHDLRREVK